MTTVFVDLMSQPSRACTLFCRAAGLPVDIEQVRLDKKQQKTPEYLAINPFGKVPALRDGEFTLPESASILRYLAVKFNVADHWYPREPKARATVESAMDWSSTALRSGAARLGWHRVVGKRMGAPTSEDGAKEALGLLKLALHQLETIWLARSPFVAGSGISIADLQIVCELEQLRMLEGAEQGPYMQELMAPHPLVQQYMARVRQELSPHYAPLVQTLCRAAEASKTRKESQSKL